MKRPEFFCNKIYHIYNRGVDKRNIFLDDIDRFRFIHDLFEFNDINPVFNAGYNFRNKSIEVGLQYIDNKNKPRKLLVEILAFCLMPNHFHLLLRQRKENGITEFMRKLGTGYTNYFNQKYTRSGVLFQGKFKALLIEKETHFIYLPHYIHTNPLDLTDAKWRQDGISGLNKILKFLEEYRWSSLPDYLNKKNFPSITQRNFLLEIFGGEKQYKKDLTDIIKNGNFEEIKDLVFE
ncbi:MAG: transposase [Candidatus Paceibacterota bacterium]|jgi:putative transposase